MPELPEVETIRRGLVTKILGKKITGMEVRKPKIVKNPLEFFRQNLLNATFANIQRRGKLLIFSFFPADCHVAPAAVRAPRNDKTRYLLVHLKMTGQLVYQEQKTDSGIRQRQAGSAGMTKTRIIAGGHPFPIIEKLPNKFSHIIFTFADHSRLFFNDQRQFGFMKVASNDELACVLNQYGLDPFSLNYNLKNFLNVINRRVTPLKAFLMNQALIAGIGNIYADEVCFRLGVRPFRRISTLTTAQKKQLFATIKKILLSAIARGGTTFSNYRNAEGKKGNFSDALMVYRRTGEKCKKCKKGVIKRIKLGQRGTHFCPECQK